MSHPLTKDRSGLYISNFPIGGEFSEQVELHTDGTLEYHHADAHGQVTDTVEGTYQIVGDKLYLTYTSATARGPKLLYRIGKRLYQADARGRRVIKAPGISGRRQFLLFGSRKRKYYLELQTA